MKTNRIRWSDNDRCLGPFLYSRDSKHYRPFALVLGSAGDQHPGCSLRVSGFGHTVIAALPAIIRPWRRKVMAKSWDPATVARLGRDWYWDTYRRDYGFSCSEGFLQVFFGRQTHDSSTTQSWSMFMPWTQWRHVRHSVYGRQGEHFADLPEMTPDGWDKQRAITDACPTMSFRFADFDGEQLLATTRIEERESHLGTGWFKWLSLFRRPNIGRSLDICFSGETGKRKGSWKGGTVGHGIEMLPGELHEAAFRRYCAENDMTLQSGVEA